MTAGRVTPPAFNAAATMKLFTTHHPSDIPPVAISGFEATHNLSDRFFAIAVNTAGEELKTTVRYDHDRNQWIFGTSGAVELVEFYKEIPANQFIRWIIHNEHISNLDLDTLGKMFNSMDEEDK